MKPISDALPTFTPVPVSAEASAGAVLKDLLKQWSVPGQVPDRHHSAGAAHYTDWDIRAVLLLISFFISCKNKWSKNSQKLNIPFFWEGIETKFCFLDSVLLAIAALCNRVSLYTSLNTFATQHYCYVWTHKWKTINEVNPHAKRMQNENIFKLLVRVRSARRVFEETVLLMMSSSLHFDFSHRTSAEHKWPCKLTVCSVIYCMWVEFSSLLFARGNLSFTSHPLTFADQLFSSSESCFFLFNNAVNCFWSRTCLKALWPQ